MLKLARRARWVCYLAKVMHLLLARLGAHAQMHFYMRQVFTREGNNVVRQLPDRITG